MFTVLSMNLFKRDCILRSSFIFSFSVLPNNEDLSPFFQPYFQMLYTLQELANDEYGVGQYAIAALGLLSATELENDLMEVMQSIKNNGMHSSNFL